MTIEVDKKDLVNLIAGTSLPSYDYINEFTQIGAGEYIGGFYDRWEWNKSGLEKLDENTLLEIYKKVK
jgi:hypothetical protein